MDKDLMTKQQEDEADSLLLAITNIAKPLTEETSSLKNLNSSNDASDAKRLNTINSLGIASSNIPSRRSRFFFQPTQSFNEELEDRKKISRPREVEIADAAIEARRKTYQEELPSALDSNIEKVREFWLREIAPLTLAAQSGSSQAKDIVQRILDVEIDNIPFMKFQRMLETASTIKMAEYIAKYIKINKSYVPSLADSTQPKKEVLVVNPSQHEQNRESVKKTSENSPGG